MGAFETARNDLQKARLARQKDEQGKSRVLSRLAAAGAIRAYSAASGKPAPPGNAFELLQNFASANQLSGRRQEALSHLCMRVDADYNLPAGIDLIQDAELIIEFLENSASGLLLGEI